MPSWFMVNVPHHPETSLRLVCQKEHRPGNRIHLEAYDGERWVYGQFYGWDTWEGHCSGILLMPEFVKKAEAHAAYYRLMPEEQGFLSYMDGAKNHDIPRYNPYMHEDKRYQLWEAGQHRAILAVIDTEG